MQSDGGLCLWENFSGLCDILSGPAGGVIGYAQACYDTEEKIPVLADLTHEIQYREQLYWAS